MKVLITGITGFFGTNMVKALKKYDDTVEVVGYNSTNSLPDLPFLLDKCDFVFDFAATHRPKDPSEFAVVNTGLLEEILRNVEKMGNSCPILYTSSIQAVDNTAYGMSKKQSEQLLVKHAEETGNNIFIYRLTNTFGPGARPNGHSVVATFCYNLAHEKEIFVENENRIIRFQYIGDVVDVFLSNLFEKKMTKDYFYSIPEEFITSIAVGELAELLKYFSECCKENKEPLLRNRFQEKMFFTYRSYLP